MKYGFVARHQSIWPVRTMCRVFAVSRAGFYEWHSRPPSRRSLEDARLMPMVRESFIASDGTYGAVRVARDLRDWGERCGKRRTGRLMRLASLRARPKRRRKPQDEGLRPEHSIAPNVLNREFQAPGPNKKWAADFTYLWTAEGWLRSGPGNLNSGISGNSGFRAGPETVESFRRYRERNREKIRARLAVSKQGREMRRVLWANQDAIVEIYRQAELMTRATGRLHVVDHIIPLQGRMVSGLHVETNLRVIEHRENAKKHNAWESPGWQRPGDEDAPVVAPMQGNLF